jgi:hypothetical protein
MADPRNGPGAATTAARSGSVSGAGEALVPPTATGGAVRETVRRLERRGLDASAARNLAALAFGVWPARSGWTVAQIEHLRFLRAIVREGALEP